MKRTEVKITSFQAEDYRLQLIYVSKELKNGIIKRYYEVRENRIIKYKSIIYTNTLEVYARCIIDVLNLQSQLIKNRIKLNKNIL